jgi:hypothetical protein
MDLIDFARQQQALPGGTACKVCDAQAEPFDVVDFMKTCDPGLYPRPLSGVPVYYHRCRRCGLVFTGFFDRFSAEDWREHVYNAGYVEVDPAYVEERPRQDAARLDAYLCERKHELIGLDYGGGSGIAARLLRELGYRYDAWDPFGVQSLTPELQGRHNFCSSFEVAEHSTDPRGMFSGILGMLAPGRVMIFVGTQVHDGLVDDARRLSWWYAAPRNGHVTLHSRRSLGLLAQLNQLDFHSFTRSTHLMSRGYTRAEVARFVYAGVARRRWRSLLRRDPLPPPTGARHADEAVHRDAA